MKKVYEKRRYQERTIESFEKWIATDSKLATIILPTGTGKTLCAALCLNKIKNKKILWVAHREELIDQAYKTLSQIIENTFIDKEIAECKASPKADIIVGSVQTLYRKRKHLAKFVPDIIIIDEYHHRSEKNVSYQGLLDRFPEARVIGLTATPWRFSGDDLPLGDVLFQMDIGTAVAHKYLVTPVPEILKSNVSLANVKTRMGDFATKELSETVNVEARNKLIANKILQYIREEKRQGILFGVDVAHAHAMYELLKNECKAIEIYGETNKDERRYSMEKLRDGNVDIFINNLCGTEGFDVPHLSFAVIARPTRSLGLYIQMSGRVLRIFPGKTDAKILDVFDKIKVRQSRITFVDLATEGDLFGERKRANSLLDADIKICGSGGKDGVDDGSFAKKLEHFPIFLLKPIADRWTTDDEFLPVTSWAIATDQRLVTWSEENFETDFIFKERYSVFIQNPTVSQCRARNIQVKHDKYGNGIIVDNGVGLEVKVEFEDTGWSPKRKVYVKISDLKYKNVIKEINPNPKKTKKDKLFYFCFPVGTSQGRVIEMEKQKWDLVILSDKKMTLDEARIFIKERARDAGVLPLVKADAAWKKGKISEKQRDLLFNWIKAGRVGFDLDLDTVNKGDASAIIDQMKWQTLINKKFGTSSKNSLLGYDSSSEDV